MYNEIMTTIVEPTLTTILTAVMTAICAIVISAVNAKKKEIVENAQNELVEKYAYMIGETVTTVVSYVNQTFVNSLKAENAFDAQAQKEALSLALKEIKKLLTADCIEYITSISKDVNKYLTVYVEAEVNSQKAYQVK